MSSTLYADVTDERGDTLTLLLVEIQSGPEPGVGRDPTTYPQGFG